MRLRYDILQSSGRIGIVEEVIRVTKLEVILLECDMSLQAHHRLVSPLLRVPGALARLLDRTAYTYRCVTGQLYLPLIGHRHVK